MNGQAELEQLLEQATEVLREAPAEIPEKFWNRRPRIEGHNSNHWEPFSTSNGTVTVRTLTSVPPDSFVYVPAIGPVRIAQYIPGQSIVVVEHRIRLDPPRSIYAAYFPIGFSREILNIQPCRGPNPDCLAAGEFIGFTPGGAATPFYVRFSDRPQIGRNEFRPEFRAEPVPSMPDLRRRPAATTVTRIVVEEPDVVTVVQQRPALEQVIRRALRLLGEQRRIGNILTTEQTNRLRCVLNLLLHNPRVDTRYIPGFAFVPHPDYGPIIHEPLTSSQFDALIKRVRKDLTSQKFASTQSDRDFLIHLGNLERDINGGRAIVERHMRGFGGAASPGMRQINDWIRNRQLDRNSIYSCFGGVRY